MMREGAGFGPAADAAKTGGMGKTLLKGAVGIAAIVGIVVGLDKLAHPHRPNTTPDNPYGLQPTSVCDQYGYPIMRDFRGIFWNKSTLSRVDLKNPGNLHQCSAAEMQDYLAESGQISGGGMMKREASDKKTVSLLQNAITHADKSC